MENKLSNKIVNCLYILGTVVLIAAFFYWRINQNSYTWLGMLAAAISVILSLLIYMKFVPQWVKFWCKDEDYDKNTEKSKISNIILIKIFLSLCAVAICYLIIIFCIRYQKGYSQTFADSINVWRETDAQSYMDIAKEWYLSEGEWGRLVQLVFLPGYPLAVKVIALLVKNYIYAGIIVSVVCFGASGCMLYKLVRLDYDHKTAIRAVKFLSLIPASFFFAGPMSESLFLLMCLLCIYCIRTKKWVLGCIFGGYASFTRSLGVTLLIPIVIELVKEFIDSNPNTLTCKNIISKTAPSFIVPAGFGVYCVINYIISGDFFKFAEYERLHWNQSLGWFFNTASYQIDYIISEWGENWEIILGLFVPNLFVQFAYLAIVLVAVKKIRASYTAWFISYYMIAIGCTWLLSGPRYLVGFAAMPIVLSAITKNKTADRIATICCLLLNIAYIYVFAVRWYVW